MVLSFLGTNHASGGRIAEQGLVENGDGPTRNPFPISVVLIGAGVS